MEKNIISLSKEFELLIYIYEQTIINKEVVIERELPTKFKLMTSTEISRSIDRFYDRCMIDFNYDNNLGRCITIEEDFLPYIKGLYNASYDSQEQMQNKEDGGR